MPFLDVSDVISDPDFADTVTRHRLVLSVNAYGEGSTVSTDTTLVAVVTQGGGDVLDRTGDAEKIKGSITVHTTGDLTAGDGTLDADEVTWRGRRYIVDSVSDWSSYGVGYVAASCTLKKLSP